MYKMIRREVYIRNLVVRKCFLLRMELTNRNVGYLELTSTKIAYARDIRRQQKAKKKINDDQLQEICGDGCDRERENQAKQSDREKKKLLVRNQFR